MKKTTLPINLSQEEIKEFCQRHSIIINRQIDLRTPADLSRYFRDEVLAEAIIIYEQN